MNAPRNCWRNACRGLTLAEMSVSMGIGALVIAGTLTLFIMFLRFYNTTSLMRNAAGRASQAMERMVVGVGTNAGLREATASTITFTSQSGGWKLGYNTNLFFQYVAGTKLITNESGKVVCANVITSSVAFYTSALSTNTINTNACKLSVTVAENAGGDTWTNTMITQVQFRN